MSDIYFWVKIQFFISLDLSITCRAYVTCHGDVFRVIPPHRLIELSTGLLRGGKDKVTSLVKFEGLFSLLLNIMTRRICCLTSTGEFDFCATQFKLNEEFSALIP